MFFIFEVSKSSSNDSLGFGFSSQKPINAFLIGLNLGKKPMKGSQWNRKKKSQ